MIAKTTLDEFRKASKVSSQIAVHKTVSLCERIPAKAFRALSDNNGSCFIELRDSSKNISISFIGLSPDIILSVNKETAEVFDGKKTSYAAAEAFNLLEKLVDHNQPAGMEIFPPGFGSFIGFLSYNAAALLEKLPDRHSRTDSIPDLYFQRYRKMIVFDHGLQTMTVTIIQHFSKDAEESYRLGMEEIDAVVEAIDVFCKKVESIELSIEKQDYEVDIHDEDFIRRIGRAKEYLLQGDIFQVVLSRSFSKPYVQDPVTLYSALRSLNPSPYHFLFHFNGYAIVGASPEKLISVHNGIVETVPIAGTRPVKNVLDGRKTIDELTKDEKEHAEHMMLVDLARNDLGAISKIGTVKVKTLKAVQQLSHVVHLISEVTGDLDQNYSSIDALKASFPAGTLTGAPKIRAMEIIDELELTRREIYGGIICTMDVKKNLESWLAIRTAFIKDGIAHVRAGAGIVLDSDPYEECLETKHKAAAVLEALDLKERHTC